MVGSMCQTERTPFVLITLYQQTTIMNYYEHFEQSQNQPSNICKPNIYIRVTLGINICIFAKVSTCS